MLGPFSHRLCRHAAISRPSRRQSTRKCMASRSRRTAGLCEPCSFRRSHRYIHVRLRHPSVLPVTVISLHYSKNHNLARRTDLWDCVACSLPLARRKGPRGKSCKTSRRACIRLHIFSIGGIMRRRWTPSVRDIVLRKLVRRPCSTVIRLLLRKQRWAQIDRH